MMQMGTLEQNGLNQPAFTYSKSTMERPEQRVKYVQSLQQRHQDDVSDVVLVSLLLTLNRFHTWRFLC